MKSKILLLAVIAILGLSVSSFAQVPPYVPTSGLVAWWSFNSNANDESGNGNDGTNNGATLTNDRYGNANKAFSFAGTSDHIAMPSGSSSSLNLTSDLSLSMWYKCSPHNGPMIAFMDNVSAAGGYGFHVGIPNNNRFSFFCSPNWYNIPSDVVPDGNWHQLIATLSGTTLKIYYDGTIDSTYLGVSPPASWTGLRTLGVGNNSTGGLQLNSIYYSGDLDDIGVWNRALTAQEVTNLYNICATQISVSITNLNASYTTNDSPVTLTGTPAGGTFYGHGIYLNTFYPSSAGTGSHTIVYAYQDVDGCSNAVCENTNVTTYMNINHIAIPESSFMIFPNPNNGNFQISLDEKYIGTIDINIFNQLGQQVFSKKYQNKQEKFERNINLNNLAKGTYTVSIKYGSKSVSQNIVLQ